MKMTQRRPDGPMWPTDAEWKARVDADMKERGISRADMARMCGVTNASISNMLSDKSQQSRLVPLVHAALAWPPPSSVSGLDYTKMLIDSQWEKMSDDERQAIRVLIETFAKKH